MLTGGTWAGLAVSDSLVYALDNSRQHRRDLQPIGRISQGSISLGTGDWVGLAVTGSLLYALENTANTVQIYTLLGTSLGSIALGAGDWQGLSVFSSTLYALDDATTAEEVLPIDTDVNIIPALGRRQSGAWTRIPIA